MADTYKNSPTWMERIEKFFVRSDMNKDGCLSIEDIEILNDNLEREVKADPALLQKARKATKEMWESAGLKPGVQLTKEQFIDTMAEFAVKEKARYQESKNSLILDVIEALFDVIDEDHNGYLDLKEYQTMMKVSNSDEETAKKVFEMIDSDKDGKLSKEELREYNIKFWFTTEN